MSRDESDNEDSIEEGSYRDPFLVQNVVAQNFPIIQIWDPVYSYQL